MPGRAGTVRMVIVTGEAGAGGVDGAGAGPVRGGGFGAAVGEGPADPPGLGLGVGVGPVVEGGGEVGAGVGGGVDGAGVGVGGAVGVAAWLWVGNSDTARLGRASTVLSETAADAARMTALSPMRRTFMR